MLSKFKKNMKIRGWTPKMIKKRQQKKKTHQKSLKTLAWKG